MERNNKYTNANKEELFKNFYSVIDRRRSKVVTIKDLQFINKNVDEDNEMSDSKQLEPEPVKEDSENTEILKSSKKRFDEPEIEKESTDVDNVVETEDSTPKSQKELDKLK